MLDIHSHVLPKMDDGSKSTDESLELLRMSKSQGVDTIFATSHFYASHEDPDRFLLRRDHAWKKLESRLTAEHPAVLLGAEVLYYPGISESEKAASLSIAGTDLILIEMPFYPWSSRIFDELERFSSMCHLTVILAHIDRYRRSQKKTVFNEMFEHPFLFQLNADAFLDFSTRRFALDMMKAESIDFLGSDCHNLSARPPRLADAKKVIEKKCGADVFDRFCARSEKLFEEHRL